MNIDAKELLQTGLTHITLAMADVTMHQAGTPDQLARTAVAFGELWDSIADLPDKLIPPQSPEMRSVLQQIVQTQEITK